MKLQKKNDDGGWMVGEANKYRFAKTRLVPANNNNNTKINMITVTHLQKFYNVIFHSYVRKLAAIYSKKKDVYN